MKAMITGVTGMIGSHVARELVRQDCEVHGLARWRSDRRNLAGILDKTTLHLGDVMDDTCIRKILRDTRPDIIYHFAAQAFNGVSWDSPKYTSGRGLMQVARSGKGQHLDQQVRMDHSRKIRLWK